MSLYVENVYSSALFELLEEQHQNNKQGFESVLTELKVVDIALKAAPELVKLALIPTISRGDKLDVIKKVFEGKVSEYTLNLLLVLTEKGRLGRFGAIYRDLRKKYHAAFGITPVTVTSAFELDKEQRDKIIAKMAAITGNEIELTEKTDKNLIGGVVLDYDGTRIDASVKSRLEALKREIVGTVL